MTKTRRKFLGAAAAVTGLAATGCNAKRETVAPSAGATPNIVLEPKWLETTIDSVPVRLRAYNGTVPGPLMTVRPGETFRVHLKNGLTNRGGGGPSPHVHDIDVPHDFEATNLHLHGMDIAPHLFLPLGTSDPKAKMISIQPGADFLYAFEVPADHPPGLYWYHPHQHGSTAVQAVSGMAGALIVKGAIDEVPEIKAARDIVLAIQDVGLFKSDEPNDTRWTYNPRPRMIWQTFGGVVQYWDKDAKPKPAFVNSNPPLNGGYTTGDYALRYFLLNGKPFYKEVHNAASPQDPAGTQLTPPETITVARGEVVRIRMLNGCSDNYMPIQVDGHDIHLLALDGVNFEAPRTVSSVSLAPANRAEFLIKASTLSGAYNIVQNAQDVQFLKSDRKVLAVIQVTAEEKPMALPAKLPAPTRYYPLIEPSKVKQPPRVITFSTAFRGPLNPDVGMDFMIDKKLYAEFVAGQEVELDTIEEWQLVLPAGENEGHPFHIHVNHFEVISVNGVKMPPGTIQDTIWIPKPTATVGSTVVLRMKFKEFTGKSVFHCHILPHEDTGMMSNFLISKKK
jgi:suppressor of ftsI